MVTRYYLLSSVYMRSDIICLGTSYLIAPYLEGRTQITRPYSYSSGEVLQATQNGM
jgi:hypothetical protein